LHNTLFHETGLPHTYGIHETTNAADIEAVIRAPDFGGASVTIPLKQDVRPFLDSVGPEIDAIGALNTIVPETSIDETTGKQITKLVGRNTDYLGMVLVLRNAGAQGSAGLQAGLVIGGGGTSRAAIYALHEMQYAPIYLLGRNPEKMSALRDAFPADYDLRILSSPQDVESVERIPTVAIGTIPANQPIDEGIKATLDSLFTKAKSEKAEAEAPIGSLPTGGKRILLEMAYKPAVTELIRLAEGAGWASVNGLEVLVGQGVKQFEYWTGVRPLYRIARVSPIFPRCVKVS
jgi:pentafunctional AROM polypeptide